MIFNGNLLIPLSSIIIVLLNLSKTFYCLPTPATQQTNGNDKATNALHAVDFMKKFGYLEKSSVENSESLYSADAIETALKEVQLYGGIPQTGQLDNKTLELMTSKRCGVPESGNLLSRNRTKRFILSAGKWKKYHLTYFIANWSPQLGEDNVRKSMKRAFESWASYSQLTFTEVFNNNADIIIAFATGNHGDGFPFDGRGNILAHAFMPGEMAGMAGDIHFDEDEEWQINPGPFDNGIDFFSVAVHELGHSLGLMHSPEAGSVMNPYYRQYNPDTFQLSYDDILAVYTNYIARRSTIQTNESGHDNDDSTESSSVPTRSTTARTRETRPNTVKPITTTSKTIITYIGDDESVDIHKHHDDRHGIPDTEAPPTFHSDDFDDICFGNFDAVAHFRSELFFFKNMQVWRLKGPGNILSGYPVTTNMFFRTPGGPSSKISAVYERTSDSNIVIFSGKQYWIYDGNQFIEGSPLPISNYGFPNYVDKIDAAMVWGKNKKTYLFSGDRYWRYDESNKAMDNNYPRSMDNFKNVPVPLDAAMTWSDGVTYFFKGKEYWSFNNTWKKTDDGYPRSATSYWLGCKT